MPATPPIGIDPRLASPARAADLLRLAGAMPALDVEDRTASDLELLGNGGFTPLRGFLGRKDYEAVVSTMRLADGQPFSIPITLSATKAEADRLETGKDVALRFRGRVVAVLHLEEKFGYDREKEAKEVFRTTDGAHPGVAALMKQGEVLLGGPVEVLAPDIHTEFGEYRFTPTQTRAMFKERGWERIVAFQTRNPVHRAHEYIQKCALEMVDGLLLHPLVGETKGDDIAADVRMRCYEVLLDKYYPEDRTLLGVFPAAMRYAGPREAIFHAVVRRNYGCTHFIVGRDHAGVGNYYGTYDAQKIFSEFAPGELGIQPVFFDHTFYCRGCGHMASDKTCAHDRSLRLALSGTKVRELLREGKMLPTEFTRPEVARTLLEAYHPEMRAARIHREGRSKGARKVVVIGLDAADPRLVFERWKAELPVISGLMARGAWGTLRSTMPPITVPAWSCMMASRDPGELGIYGLRNRRSRAYGDMAFSNSTAVREKRAFEILSDAGRAVVTIGVPGTFPPRKVNGVQVGCFMTPDTGADYTWPPEFKEEIDEVVGRYILDAQGIRSADPEPVLKQVYDMTEKRFKLAEHVLTTKPWDFFMMVEMGPDRIHHGFWKHFDETHPRHVKGNPHANAVKDYYKFLDHKIGELLKLLDQDTTVMVLSEYGSQPMLGGIALNEWLVDAGWLVLRGPKPSAPRALRPEDVDWPKTRAWGEGGYYGRVFLNVRGREPEGAVPPGEVEKVRTELAAGLAGIRDEEGRDIGTVVHRPEDVYAATHGVPPDLIVCFGGLRWRSVGSIGTGAVVVRENDTGPDDVNHSEEGFFVMAGPGTPGANRRLEDLSIYDVGPTVLHLMGVQVPSEMRGKVIG
jgi:ATP sulfurylase